MKKFIHRVVLVCMTLTLIHCNDHNFLMEDPTTFYTVDNAFQTTAQVEQVITTLYSHLRNMEVNPDENGGLGLWKGYAADYFDKPWSGRSSTLTNYNNFTPDNGDLKTLYDNFYQLISRANLAIYAANIKHIEWGNADEKAYTLAQARFIRAYCYGNLAILWGGVPLVTELLAAPKLDFVRESRTNIYQFCIDELKAIENDMPETTPQGGRLVKGAVQHYLSEMYLALGCHLKGEGKSSEASAAFQNCITTADKLINGGTYRLMDSRFGGRKDLKEVSIPIYNNGVFAGDPVYQIVIPTNHIWDLYQEGSVNYQDGNKESIFSLQIDYMAYKAEDKKSKLPYARSYGGSFRDAAPDHTKGMLEDVGGRGIHNRIPIPYWREAVWDGKYSKDLRNSEVMIRRQIYGNAPASPYYCKPVPWSVLNNTEENRSRAFPLSAKVTTDKFTGVEDGENRSNLFRDEYVFRLAETILIRAEAKQRTENKAGAAADINLLRERAQCDYMVTAADMDDNFDMICDERCRELMFEEHRWNTLLRMGGTTANDRIKKYCLWETSKNTMTRKFNLWPIPQAIIDANIEAVIEQNPGWE